MVKHVIVINPISGKCKGKKYGIAVLKLLKKYDINAEIVISEYPNHLTEISKKLSQEEKTRFYVLGGDGTLNEVASGILNTDSEIVAIPTGTGNDFVKSISYYNSIRKIVRGSIKKDAKKTDILKLNNNRYCVNILNCGFDATVAKNLDIFRKLNFLSGKAKYNISLLYTLLRNKNYKFKIRIDKKKTYKGSFTLAVIANGKYYGGGVKPCPEAIPNDGILNICIVDATSFFDKIRLLPKYKRGEHLNLKQVHIEKASDITIVSNLKFPASIDGEVIYTKKIHAKIEKDAINVIYIDK